MVNNDDFGRQMKPMMLAAYLLAMLLVIDFLCMALHIGRMIDPQWGTDYFSIEYDRGYGEFFQYMKELWIVLLLVRLGIHKRVGGFFAWALVFTYLLLDDALQIHERWGGVLSQTFSLPEVLGMRSQDMGELLVTAAAGSVLLVALVLAYWRDDAWVRKASRQLFCMTVCIGLFGVVVDMLHSILRLGDTNLYHIAGLVEDGGEMLVMSVVVWYAFVLTSRRGVPVRSIARSLAGALGGILRLA